MSVTLAEETRLRAAETDSAPVDGGVMKDWRRRFRLINRERLGRVHQVLNPNQKQFLDLLPLLFHINFPLLPGYVGRTAPAGMAEYAPDKRALAAARRVARSFEYERRLAKSVDIHGLYLMGSSGTVAYSRNSDFDIWVCHRPGLSPERREALRRKTAAIGEWADTLGLEVHFFNMVAADFREGRVHALSSESSGSAQRYLLLDEFYRTGLLLCGRFPIWWLVPCAHEREYAGYVRMLTTRRFVDKQEFLDFGPVAEIPAAEFLGATLWQLTKAIRSPHKSLLKIILLEAYATEYPDIDLLSLRFKQAVQAGEHNLNSLDPYVALGRKIEDFLLRIDDRNRLELARRSFYFKVNEPLASRPTGGADGWRRRVMREIADAWGWDDAMLRALDSRRTWKIDRVLRERRDLVDALMHSYRLLSRFARDHGEAATVSDHDMTILGRQLFAVFEHKPGKVERVNAGISADLTETRLTILNLPLPDNRDYWVLYRGTLPAGEDPDRPPLKRARTLLELVAWCHFNGVITPSTRITVHPGRTLLTRREVEEVHAHLRTDFPPALADGGDVDDFARAPEGLRASLFVNLGVDPMRKYTLQGKNLTSAQVDALSYGGSRENLVREIEYLLVTSWREILTFRFRGVDGLMACLCEHTRWISAAAGPVRCHALTPGYAQAISRRMSALFDAVSAWFLAGAPGGRARYVIQVEKRYHVLLREEDTVRHEFSGGLDDLLKGLGRPNPEATTVTIDGAAHLDAPLALVFRAWEPGTIHCAFRVTGVEAALYVVDESGALFCDTHPFFSEAALVNHLDRFFASVRGRERRVGTDPEPGPDGAPVRFFRVVRHGSEPARLRRIETEPLSPAPAALDVRVVGEVVDGETEFTLYCDRREFSTREHGGDVFEAIGRHILGRRRAGARYPLYITELDLSRLSLGGAPGEPPRTIHYLHYKKRIEAQLNAVLKAG